MAIPELSGVVKSVSWRSGFTFTRIDFEREGKSRKTSYNLKEHWVVVLSEVKGIDAEAAKYIGWAFSNSEPKDAVCATYEGKANEVLVWIPGGDDLGIKPGCSVTMKNVRFQADEYGASLIYGAIAIDPNSEGAPAQQHPKGKDESRSGAKMGAAKEKSGTCSK